MNGKKEKTEAEEEEGSWGIFQRRSEHGRHIQLEPNKKERESKDRQLIRTQNKKPKTKTKNMSAPQTNPMP